MNGFDHFVKSCATDSVNATEYDRPEDDPEYDAKRGEEEQEKAVILAFKKAVKAVGPRKPETIKVERKEVQVGTVIDAFGRVVKSVSLIKPETIKVECFDCGNFFPMSDRALEELQEQGGVPRCYYCYYDIEVPPPLWEDE